MIEFLDPVLFHLIIPIQVFQWILTVRRRVLLNPSCTKVFGIHTFYEGGGGIETSPPMISKTADSTKFNFGRPLGLSMRGKRPVELMI